MNKPITNMAASVHAKLLNLATSGRRPFNELLQYYAMERFLYRLSQSKHADQFVLKGALMLQFWGGSLTRATKDVDLLGRVTATVDEMVDVIRDCLLVPVDEDGLRFDDTGVRGEEIRPDANYDGVRIHCVAHLGKARITLRVDIGFGDVITPEARRIEYPTLLEFAAPTLFGYTPETTVAEKFEAMVVLDMANTRLKDFLDVWMLSQARGFSGSVLAEAIDATFRRRSTPLPESPPIALTPPFYSAADKQAQWVAYVRKARVEPPTPTLEEAVAGIGALLMPIVYALVAGASFDSHWPAGGPWSEEI